MKKFILIAIAFCCISSFVQAQDLEVRIRTDRMVYYYEQSIPVYFTIRNQSDKSIPVKVSTYSFLNYELEVFTLENVSVKEKDEFFSKRFNTQGKLRQMKNFSLLFQNVNLEPSQIVGIKLDLMDYFHLPPGTYIIRAKFYPLSSFYNPSRFVQSHYIRLIIKEGALREREKLKEKEKLKVELKNIITPQDSISAFFKGKMQKNWEKFFYVCDLRRMIQQFPVFYKSFKAAADQEKNQVVTDFRRFLRDLNSDERIIKFDIVETVVRKKKAISKVVLTTRWKETFIKREYRFGLIKKDHWYIYGYTVIQK